MQDYLSVYILALQYVSLFIAVLPFLQQFMFPNEPIV